MAERIDELSQILGSISADIKNIAKKTDSIDDKVETLQEHSVEQRVTIKAAHKRLDQMNDDHKDLKKTVDGHENLKNRGLGIVAFIGFVFGTLGAGIGKILHLWN